MKANVVAPFPRVLGLRRCGRLTAGRAASNPPLQASSASAAQGQASRLRLAAIVAVAALLNGCAGSRAKVDVQEAFDSVSTYTRAFGAGSQQTCEAGRRALLSQGYVISLSTPDQVRGRKSFQPLREAHVEVEFNVVCAPQVSGDGRRTLAFVNAVQDRYALKKSNQSASVGVGAFGSLSVPFTGSEESMVKVASATITSAPFYDRFFQLLDSYLSGSAGELVPSAAGLSEVPEPKRAAGGAGSGAASAAVGSPTASPPVAAGRGDGPPGLPSVSGSR